MEIEFTNYGCSVKHNVNINFLKITKNVIEAMCRSRMYAGDD